MNRPRLLLFAALLGLVGAFFASGLHRYLSLDMLKSRQEAIQTYREAHPFVAEAVYAAVYVAVAGLSLPFSTLMTLAGGAVFGLVWGTALVSFASACGATLAFLSARFLFRDALRARFGTRLQAIDDGVARDGWLYLLTLRLVPVFPFFLVNLGMGLTSMPTFRFYWVSQAGMLAVIIVYVNAGTQLGRLDSLAGILSPSLLGSFALLAVFPWLARRLVDWLRLRKLYVRWIKPKRFDRNVVVIGAGAAGLVSAYVAAALKAKVTLVEKRHMGGDCLNTGCVPSKALIRTARLLAQIRHASAFGIEAHADLDFAAAMERVRQAVQTVAPHDSVECYTALGVEVLQGDAKILSPWEVEIRTAAGVQILTTRAIIIAAGAKPFVPPIPGIEAIDYLTSDTVWALRVLPKRLLVLGGGPVGCELAQCFARFGSHVTVVETLPRLLAREDPDVSAQVEARFRAEGVDVRVEHLALRFSVEDGEQILVAEHLGAATRIAFDQIVVAVGRVANTEGYGLEALGIHAARTRRLLTNGFLETRYPNIYACGDVTGPFQLTHAAAHQAWHAVANALFGAIKKRRVDYAALPQATFTDPEVARVGLNEADAKARGIVYEISVYRLDGLDRALIDGQAEGFVKVLTAPGKDRILGATIVGEQAGELIAEFALAMKLGAGLNKILGTVHAYPTLAEANKQAAGVWKRAHAPQKLLDWAERYHAWRRG